jgi:glycosyltransferase involved in cell wall biosynthesis
LSPFVMHDGPVTEAPSVSVVVATHNRCARLPRLVEALEKQVGVDAFEVVVVDDASSDDTWRTLEQLARTSSVPLRPLRLTTNSGPATARNRGWRAGRAPLVVFTDDDCVPAEEWVAGLARGLGAADVVQGRTAPNPAHGAHYGPFCRTLDVASESGFYQTCNIGYRRTVLEALDGFDERFRHPAGEDTDLAWRARAAGYRTAFEPEALVWHDVRPSRFVTQLRDTWRWEGVVLSVHVHPQLRGHLHRTWFWKSTHPAALAAGVAVVVLVGPRRPLWLRVAAVGVLERYRRFRMPLLWGSRRQRVLAMPLVLIADLAEVAVMLAASARYRTLVI